MPARLLNRLLPDAVALSLHGIGEPHSGVDDRERDYWLSAERFRAVVDGSVAVARTRGLELALTFDDANLSDYTEALPVLAERGLTGRFFILTGRVGQPHYLSGSQLREMADRGMILGSHGVEHVRWTGLSDAELEVETTQARHALEDILGMAVDEVACPFGAIDARVYRQLERAGFRRVYTSYVAATRLDAPLVDRFTPTADFDPARDLAGRLSIAWRCIDAVRRLRRWRALTARTDGWRRSAGAPAVMQHSG